ALPIWAARPVNQLKLRRQQPVEAMPDDAVRLPSADLHDDPGAGHGAGDLVAKKPDLVRVAILGQVFHICPSEGISSPSSSPSMSSSRSRLRVSSASCSSMMFSAKPT